MKSENNHLIPFSRKSPNWLIGWRLVGVERIANRGWKIEASTEVSPIHPRSFILNYRSAVASNL